MLQEAAITTREARKRLPAGLYWRGIDPEVHLGYRKGKRGGVWLARWRHGKGYRQDPIGTADDALDEGTLDFHAAVRMARDRVESARVEAKAAAAGPVLTVAHAVEAYIAERDARDSRRKGRAVNSDAASRLTRYVIGRQERGRRKTIPATPLATLPLHTMKEADLLAWKASLPVTTKATTAQRLVNDLKAALNGAYAVHRHRLGPTLPTVIKHGLHAADGETDEVIPVARENQILTDAQVAQLLRAAREIDAEGQWEGDLFRMFQAHGETLDGVRVANTEAWGDDAAAANLRRAYRAAINKDVDSIIVTKSVGDVPLFANTPAGRALLQFRSFALASNQRVLLRGLQEDKTRFVGGVVGMTTIGAFIYALKQLEAGRDLSDNPGTWIAEGLDRSGIFSVAFELNNAMEKIGAPGLYAGTAAMFPDASQRQPASRYAIRSKVGSFLGPSFETATDTVGLVSLGFENARRAASGEGPALTEGDVGTIRRLTPYASLPYFRWLIDGMVVPQMKEAVR